VQIVQKVGVGKKGRVMCNDEVSYDADRLPSRDETRTLYDSVGWAAYTEDLDALIRGLENSAVVVTARSGGELIGLARIVSDQATIAYLQDVLVHPSFQRRGIATTLVNRAFAPFSRVRQHVLLTDAEPGQRAFYESIGFTEIRDLSGQGCRSFVRFNP
jgi:acetyltransferase, GNAT family